MELKLGYKWSCLWTLVLVLSGFVTIFIHPVLLDLSISVSQHSLAFKLWLQLPFHTSIDFYFFNWTNPQEIHNKSTKPRFQEVGPYRYWQTNIKENVTWNDNGTITFRQHNLWNHDTSFGNASLDDNITTLDVVTLMTGHLTRKWNWFFRKSAFTMLSGVLKGMTMTRTPRELIFDGYNEPMLKLGRSMPFFSHLNLPNWDKFGFFYTRNDSSDYDGVLNMDITTEGLGQAYSYNYDNHTHLYESECGNVEGSFGQFFPRNPPQDYLKVFFLETKTANYMTYAGNERVRGILGYKYVAEDRMLDNGTKFPENRCFCNGECVPSGLLNFSTIKYGMPVFGSLPHFYRADPYFLDQVEGLKPSPDKHDFAIIIEPSTGIPLKMDIGIQANFLLQPITGTKYFDSAPRLFLPVFWLKQTMEMTELMVVLMWVIVSLPAICRSMGISMILIGCSLLVRAARRTNKFKPLSGRIKKYQERQLMQEYSIVNTKS